MFVLNRRYLRYFDWYSLALITLLMAIGLLFVFSTTHQCGHPSGFLKKQAFGAIIGLAIYFAFSLADYRALCRLTYIFHFAVLALLVFTIVKGSIGMGARRWINLGLFRFQPSELVKVSLPGFITYFLHADGTSLPTFKRFIPVLSIVLFSFVLILKQPDLGTALVVLASSMVMLWYSGVGKKFFVAAAIASIITAPILWKCLKPYQKTRVVVFLGGGKTDKERYQIEQSKIAIGSGGIAGKGFMNGTQNRLMFLPESRTDFIFSIICEETGFLGAMLVLLLYATLLIRLLYKTNRVHNFYTRLLALGLISYIAISTIVNMGMVTGMLPIVGVPLPLMSYGISHLWTTLASLGWLNGIMIREQYKG